MSLSSFAASAIKQDISRNVNQAIGKPFDGLTSAGSRGPGHSDINWHDFNYPPLLQLIHYDLEELPSHLCGIVRLQNACFVVTTVLCVVGVISTLIIMMITDADWKWLFQSLLHLVILPPVSLAIFYAGYRGLVEPDANLLFRFKVSQFVASVVYLLLGVLPIGAKGLFMLGDASKSLFWMIVIIIESCLWLVNCFLAGWSFYQAYTYDAFRGAGGQI
mmetsp:Transcript_50109/g.92480  ORF Transcript_50109/g.92480 Transcript_50109/m.92480 type:complete len:218 (-) Transcript_50109:87-740(-)